MTSLPVEAMSYKQQIKENELITKLRIIRLVKASGLSHKQVAAKFQCHRNTISNILRDFEKEFDQQAQNKLLFDSSWKLKELKKTLLPLKNKSRKPFRHPAQASEAQEAAIAEWLFKEKEEKPDWS